MSLRMNIITFQYVQKNSFLFSSVLFNLFAIVGYFIDLHYLFYLFQEF